MKITFIGHGYVGLVTASVYADLGNTVWVIGRTKEKIDNLKRGIPPFFEPGLEEVVKKNVKAGRLKFTLEYKEAIPGSEVVFIAVGTPPKFNGEADLTSVFEAADKISHNLSAYTVVVTKSTVPPGTNRQVGEIVGKNKPKKASFDIASIPEFLREGTALSDTLHPDRIVIGVENPKAKKILLDLHKPIDGKLVVCNIESAEMIKYASNALLSTKISFANALAIISERVGADAEKVLEGVGLDKRLGRAFLYPGVGYGGSCFPKDIKALIAISAEVGYDFGLLKEVDRVNQQTVSFFIEKILTHLKPISGKTIGILGLSFKPNTDDMREAPSLKIIKALQEKGVKVRAYDPVAIPNAQRLLKDVTYFKNAYDLVTGTEALVVVTEWNEFKQLDLGKIRKLMKSPYLFDGRNIYDPQQARNLGFKYFSVGRP